MAGSVVGFHGTSIDAARSILDIGFLPSQNAYDWLGDGIYFWENASKRAEEWAHGRFGAKAAVLGAEILLEDCMDFLDTGWEDPLRAAYASLFATLSRAGIAMPAQKPGRHYLDRAIINHAVVMLKRHSMDIRAVRAAFREGDPIYPDSQIYTRSHVQIAVRDPAIIIRRWLVNPRAA